MSQSLSSAAAAAVKPALAQPSAPPVPLSLSSPALDDIVELPKRPPSRRTSAGPASLSPQLREEAAERKQPEPQIDPLTGAVLHCLSFTTGNPAVETVHGWLFVQQPPHISHPPGLRASRQPEQQQQQDDSDAQPHSSPSSTSSFSSSFPSISPSHAVSAEAERDEKWVQVAAGRRPSKAQTVAAASPRSQQSRGRRSPSLSSSTLARPSPSLSPLTPLPASFSSPSPLTLTAHSEEKLQEHKTLFAETRRRDQPALALSAPLSVLPTSPPPSPSPQPLQLSSSSSSSPVVSESALLYVFDVPSHVTIPEFQDFISEHSELVVHMQLVITATHADEQQLSASASSASAQACSSCYTVLLSFHQPSDASAFLSHYNLHHYNDIEKDVCRVAHLHHVSFDDPRYHFPFTVAPAAVPTSAALPSAAVPSVLASSSSSSLSSALPSHDELHVCPVCLDPIHPPSASLLTILCLHHFHLHCLSLWSDSTCPVCRFSLHPPILSFCQSCSHSQPSSLWMCILCGHVGCSRYIGGHAFKHWEDSGHGYALSVSTQRVWDYVREEYVHRLVSTGDSNGKIVELRSGRKKAATRRRSRRGGGAVGVEAAAAEEREEDAEGVLLDEADLSISLKLEDLLIEYNYLLSSQLDQQRSFYQQQLAALAASHSQQQAAASSALASLHGQLLDVTTAVSRVEAEVAEAEKEEAAAEAEGQRLRVEWGKLSAMNERLVKKQREERERAEREDRQREEEDAAALRQKDEEIRQLEEQLRDLDFFLNTQRRVGKSGLRGDIQDGKLFVTGNEEQPAADSKHDDRRTAGGAAGNRKKKR